MNKTLLRLVFFTVLGFCTISCKQTSKEVKTIDIEKNTTQVDSFEYKLKNKPKFFLKLWDNMTKEEYSKVLGILKKDGKIDSFGKYIVAEETVKLEAIEDNNGKIIGISLYEFSEKFYNLLKDKYKLQPLITENLYFDSYIEEDPCYLETNCQDRLKKGKFVEKLEKEELHGLVTMFDSKVLKEGYREIETATSNIIISHSKSNEYKFKLGLGYYDPKFTFFLKLNNNDPSKRIVVRYNRDIKYVSYYSVNYFERREKEEKNSNIYIKVEEDRTKQKINKVREEI